MIYNFNVHALTLKKILSINIKLICFFHLVVSFCSPPIFLGGGDVDKNTNFVHVCDLPHGFFKISLLKILPPPKNDPVCHPLKLYVLLAIISPLYQKSNPPPIVFLKFQLYRERERENMSDRE